MRLKIPGIAFLALVLAGLPVQGQQPAGPFEAIACAPRGADVAAALAGGFVHVTRDSGATWAGVFLDASFVDEGDDEDTESAQPEWPGPPIEDDLEDFEEGIDELEPEWLDGPEREQASGEAGAVRAMLAVADDGRWAVARGETLLVGDGVDRREIGLPPAVRGLRFDGAGNLWIAAERRLLRIDRNLSVREVQARPSGAPVRGPGGGVLVPVADGLLLCCAAPGGVKVKTSARLSAAAERAVAWNPTRPSGALVASRGRLERVPFGDDGAEDEGFAFPDADRLLQDSDGALLLRRRDGSWQRRHGTGWRSAEILDADVDAAGRFWIAADRGISAPARRQTDTGVRPSFEAAGFLEPVDDVGPPPCERALAFPVPRVDLFFGIGHGSTRTTTLPEDADHLARRSWIRGGLRLTGSFGRGAGTDCLPRTEAWAGRQEQRRRRLSALGRAHALAVARLAAADSADEAARARFEAERLAELIRLMTGGFTEEGRP